MAGVVADPAFFLDQMGDPRRRPQAALVAQRLRPSLEAAFDSPQIFLAQSRFPSRSSGPLQPPQSAFLQLLRPATDGLSMSTDAASNFRLVYALPQQFGRLTAALFQPYEVPANSCWISHAETVAQKTRNVTILCDSNNRCQHLAAWADCAYLQQLLHNEGRRGAGDICDRGYLSLLD